MNKLTFIAILSVCLVVPFSIDIFIPGLPAMSQEFPENNVSLMLSVALLGFAIAQLFYGPLLDRFGRRPILLLGLLIYTLASAEIVLVNSFHLLIIGRFFQAIGACSATIAVFAIARDVCDKEKLVKTTSLLMAMIGISPITAPLLGSLLNNAWGWRASFIFLFGAGCCYTVLILCLLKETLLHKNPTAIGLKNIIVNYTKLIKIPNFMRYCLTGGFSYGILFSYFSLSTLFIIQQLHYSLISYSLLFSCNAVAIIVMAIVTPRIVKKISFQKVMKLGLITIIGAGIIMWLLNYYLTANIYSFVLPMFLTTIGIGMIRPTASAGAMQLSERNNAGSAAALFNFIAFICGSIATTIATQLIHQPASFGVFIVLVGASGLVIVFFNKRRIIVGQKIDAQ